jgi:membrane protein DedA with SNARE-associated domain
MQPKTRLNLIRLLVLGGVILLTVLLIIYREQIQELERFGYAGIFLVSIFANATIIIPLPGVALTSVMGAVFNPFWVAVAAGSGAALGEFSGYAAGFSGQALIEDAKAYERVTNWMKKHGDLTILVLAFIPNPLFDMAGMVAGALKMNLWRFTLYCTIGKILKMLIFAYFGSYLGDLFSQIIP